MPWFLDFWKAAESKESSVEKDFDRMLKSNKGAQTRAVRLVLGVEEFGPDGYKMPHNKDLGNGLFELRDRVDHYRFYYCLVRENLLNEEGFEIIESEES